MKIAAFLVSALCALAGACFIAGGMLLQALYPKIGFLIFKAAGPGSYSAQDYVLELRSFTTVSAVMLLAGLAAAVGFYLAERRERARPTRP